MDRPAIQNGFSIGEKHPANLSEQAVDWQFFAASFKLYEKFRNCCSLVAPFKPVNSKSILPSKKAPTKIGFPYPTPTKDSY